jgi:hypothetical protein
VRDIEADIIRVREETWRSDMAPSAFVLFHDQFTASVAAQSVIHPEVKTAWRPQQNMLRCYEHKNVLITDPEL